jgi:hypothetical protein
MDSTNVEQVQQVFTMFAPEYAEQIALFVKLALGAITLYFTILQPFINWVSSKKERALLKDENVSLKEQLASILAKDRDAFDEMINKTLSVADKATIRKNIIDLEFKLNVATIEQKLIIQAELDRQKELLNV